MLVQDAIKIRNAVIENYVTFTDSSNRHQPSWLRLQRKDLGSVIAEVDIGGAMPESELAVET